MFSFHHCPSVCLSVCLLTGLHKYYCLEFYEKNQNRVLGQTEIILNFVGDLDYRLDPPQKTLVFFPLLDYTITTDGTFMNKIRRWGLTQIRSNYILRMFWITSGYKIKHLGLISQRDLSPDLDLNLRLWSKILSKECQVCGLRLSRFRGFHKVAKSMKFQSQWT